MMSENSFKHISGQAVKEQIIVFGNRLFDAYPLSLFEAENAPQPDGAADVRYMAALGRFLFPHLDKRRITGDRLQELAKDLPAGFKLDTSDTPTDVAWFERLGYPLEQSVIALSEVLATLMGTEGLDLPETGGGAEGKA